MRIIIFGAGAIGGVIGGHLARTGQSTILIGRPKHVKAISEKGLRLVTPSGTEVVKPFAVASPGEIEFKKDDVVFLTMKGQDTEKALKDLQTAAKDIPIFCFQNGVRNEEIAIRYFPRVYGVMVQVSAIYVSDGEVMARRDPPGWFVMGRYPNGTDELTESIAASLRTASFLVKVSDDVIPYKWGKLHFNLSNAPEAITNSKGGEVDLISQAAEHELEELLKVGGIHWVSSEDLKKEWPEITAVRGKLTADAKDSTWQSLTRGTGTIETEFINGETVRLAKKLGRRAPVNETLVRIAQEMSANHDSPGKYTPAQLMSIVSIAR